MNTKNEMTSQAQTEQVPSPNRSGGMLTAYRDLEQMFRVADYLARSSIVPKAFAGQPGSVMIALNMAQRLRMDPFMVMQNIAVVNGSAGMSGKFAAALLNRSPKYRRIEYRHLNGKDYTGGMQVVGHRVDGGEDVGTAITPEMVKAEGWNRNPKWSSMPEQMYRYRAASFFARAFVPEELMGMQTVEELQDVANGEMRVVSPRVGDAVTPSFLPRPTDSTTATETDEGPITDEQAIECLFNELPGLDLPEDAIPSFGTFEH